MAAGRLKDRVVIVTGGARGIGRSYALAVAEEGARVLIADLAEGAEAVGAIQARGGVACYCRTDVSDETSAAAMARAALEQLGGIDVLINNAALYRGLVLRPFIEISGEEWDRMMAVNLRGLFYCAKAVFPTMKARTAGKIINIASSAIHQGMPGMLHYVTSKAGVVGFTRAMAREVGRWGITVNAVAPGYVLDEASRGLDADKRLPFRPLDEIARQARCLKRDQVEADLVGTILYLCSADSDFLTGQLITVDGGDSLY
ncbi:MAG: SDR family oxidoreductase [Deltaproteobacteria bacterium]|nr:SDR family oxidoreductase [Deltaproteobacteria bacterium]MBI3078136.1 SDR family oxidoreductase [Deltaproteobacteria bacterium]